VLTHIEVESTSNQKPSVWPQILRLSPLQNVLKEKTFQEIVIKEVFPKK
jgi:hypothetical protein